ncbi:MAG: hypothetical protein JSS12_10870 [Verrucomicrobia bacterium]|nr:hypothetical protein [Verrucomicrobiota bacterium]
MYTLESGSYNTNNPYKEFTRLWQASEAYLDVGQKRYRVADLEKLSLSEDHSSVTTSEVVLRVVKAVSYIFLFPLALGAVAVCSYYRSKWRISEHIAQYPGISDFPLTPPGKPIPTLNQLLESRKPKETPQPAPQKVPSLPPVQYNDFPEVHLPELHLPVPQSAPQPEVQQTVLGEQIAGNDAVRLIRRDGNLDLASNSVVTIDGASYLYIRGNGDRDIYIRQ